MVRIKRWFDRQRKVVWAEPEVPRFVKINPLSPPGEGEGLQPGDMTMARAAVEFLALDEDDPELRSPCHGSTYPPARAAAALRQRDGGHDLGRD